MRVRWHVIIASGVVLAVTLLRSTASDPSSRGTRRYYVSPTGNDRSDGLSPRSAWQTPDRVNKGPAGGYRAGDSVLFEGGKTFRGSLQFTPSNFPANAHPPITIGSYGRGRARIVTAVGTSTFTATDVAGVRIADLVFAVDGKGYGGIGFMFTNSTGQPLRELTIRNVEISGFVYGVFVAAGDQDGCYEGIDIERVDAHDNGLGLSFFGYFSAPVSAEDPRYGIVDLKIRNCRIHHNAGAGQRDLGAGIFMINADRVLIEGNAVHDNGGDTIALDEIGNGPSAVTVYGGRKVVIQNNEICRQRYSPKNHTDNAGIDLWALGSVIQYNFIHDNEGWGLTLGGSPAVPGAGWPSMRNTIRYNIIANNGRKLKEGSRLPDTFPQYWAASVLMFGELHNFQIHNNTFYSAGHVAKAKPEVRQGILYICCHPSSGIYYRNNLFIADGDVPFLQVPAPGLYKDFRFENNGYIGGSPDGKVEWESVTYDSIHTWSDQTGQETVGGRFAARLATLKDLVAPGADRAAGYRLALHSSLAGASMDLTGPPGMPGPRDYFDNPLPKGARLDIGAHQLRQR